MAAGNGRHIIVVGGGASGVLLACHLLRDANNAISVTLIEKRQAIGRGMAYDGSWRDAPRHSAGLAPDPAKTPEAIVQIYTARAFRWALPGRTGWQHLPSAHDEPKVPRPRTI